MYVFVKAYSGLIDEATYFNDAKTAIKALANFAKTMKAEKDDGSVFGPDGLIANAKHFMDENDQYIGDDQLIESLAPVSEEERHVYIIGNPVHYLGFMVASPDDPLGYDNPAEAVSDLGQMRQDAGSHLKLYQVIPVKSVVLSREELEKHNADCEVENFDFSLVKEHLT